MNITKNLLIAFGLSVLSSSSFAAFCVCTGSPSTCRLAGWTGPGFVACNAGVAHHIIPTQPAAKVVLDGVYAVQLKIADKVYNDILEIKGKNSEILMSNFSGPIMGSMTVPGVFTSVISGNAVFSINQAVGTLDFEITATENNQNYKVIYHLSIDHGDFNQILQGHINPQFKGTAVLENEDLLGQVTANKLK